jgi:hypothetical protein
MLVDGWYSKMTGGYDSNEEFVPSPCQGEG